MPTTSMPHNARPTKPNIGLVRAISLMPPLEGTAYLHMREGAVATRLVVRAQELMELLEFFPLQDVVLRIEGLWSPCVILPDPITEP